MGHMLIKPFRDGQTLPNLALLLVFRPFLDVSLPLLSRFALPAALRVFTNAARSLKLPLPAVPGPSTSNAAEVSRCVPLNFPEMSAYWARSKKSYQVVHSLWQLHVVVYKRNETVNKCLLLHRALGIRFHNSRPCNIALKVNLQWVSFVLDAMILFPAQSRWSSRPSHTSIAGSPLYPHKIQIANGRHQRCEFTLQVLLQSKTSMAQLATSLERNRKSTPLPQLLSHYYQNALGRQMRIPMLMRHYDW